MTAVARHPWLPPSSTALQGKLSACSTDVVQYPTPLPPLPPFSCAAVLDTVSSDSNIIFPHPQPFTLHDTCPLTSLTKTSSISDKLLVEHSFVFFNLPASQTYLPTLSQPIPKPLLKFAQICPSTPLFSFHSSFQCSPSSDLVVISFISHMISPPLILSLHLTAFPPRCTSSMVDRFTSPAKDPTPTPSPPT